MTRSLNLETFGGRLAHAIALAKSSRKALAEALGTSPQAIGQVVSGDTKAMTAENCARAARFLRVDGFWLATGDGEAQPDRMNFDPTLSLQEADLVKAFRMLSHEDQDEIANDVGVRARRVEQIIRRELAKIDADQSKIKRAKAA